MIETEIKLIIIETLEATKMTINGYVNEYLDSTYDQMSDELAQLEKDLIEKYIERAKKINSL